MKIILLRSFFLILVFSLYPAKTHAATTISDSLAIKVDLLQAQNQNILDTVYWTIGTIGALFAAIVGLNIYSNYRINIEKYNQLKKEIEDKYVHSKEDLLKILDTSLLKKVSELDFSTQRKIKSEMSKYSERIDDAYRETLFLKVKRHDDNHEQGSILTLIEVLELDIEKGLDFRIHESMGKILAYVGEHPIRPDVSMDLNKALAKLPQDYEPEKAKILAKIETIYD